MNELQPNPWTFARVVLYSAVRSASWKPSETILGGSKRHLSSRGRNGELKLNSEASGFQIQDLIFVFGLDVSSNSTPTA